MTIRRPALLIAYGPEARAFLHSGFRQGLVDAGMMPVVFSAQPLPEGLESLPFPTDEEPLAMRRMRGLSRRAQGWGAARMAEKFAASFAGGTAGWRKALSDAGVDALICASYNSVRTLPALQTAANMGLPTLVFENSWKDAARRAYAPTSPTAIGFAAESAREAYFATNGEPEAHAVCGSLHLSALARAGALDRRAFCARLGLDPSRPIVCWSTARAGGIADEPRWVRQLLFRLSKLGAGRPQLLLRTNPMDGVDDYADLASHADVALLRPRWEWNPSADWCCPLEEDALLWASAIRHSIVNVSIASTVTLECAANGRPVINLLFSHKATELFHADFYAEARRNGWAQPASTWDQLEELILQRLANPWMAIGPAPPLNATSKALELVNRVAARGQAPIRMTRWSTARA